MRERLGSAGREHTLLQAAIVQGQEGGAPASTQLSCPPQLVAQSAQPRRLSWGGSSRSRAVSAPEVPQGPAAPRPAPSQATPRLSPQPEGEGPKAQMEGGATTPDQQYVVSPHTANGAGSFPPSGSVTPLTARSVLAEGLAPGGVVGPGYGGDQDGPAAARSALRQVLEGLLGEAGPKLDHYVLTPKAVVAVAKEKQLQAAQEAGAQSEERLSRRLKAQEARVQKDGEEKLQKALLDAKNVAEGVAREQQQQLEVLRREVEALSREKKKLYGRSAQLSREAKEASDTAAAARQKLEAAEAFQDKQVKATQRAESALAKAQAECSRELQELRAQALERQEQQVQREEQLQRELRQLQAEVQEQLRKCWADAEARIAEAAARSQESAAQQQQRHAEEVAELVQRAKGMQQELTQKLAVADVSLVSLAQDRAERWAVAVQRHGEEAAGLRQLAEAARAEVAAAAREMGELGAQCLGRLKELKELEQGVRELGPGGVGALHKELANVREQAETQAAAAADLRQQLASSREETVAAAAQAAALQARAAGQADLQGALDQARAKLQDRDSGADSLRRQLDEKGAALDRARAGAVAAEQQLQLQRQEQQRRLQHLEEAVAEGAAAASRLEGRANELQALVAGEAERLRQAVRHAADDEAHRGAALLYDLRDRYFLTCPAAGAAWRGGGGGGRDPGCSTTSGKDAAGRQAGEQQRAELQLFKLQPEELLAAIESFPSRKQAALEAATAAAAAAAAAVAVTGGGGSDTSPGDQSNAASSASPTESVGAVALLQQLLFLEGCLLHSLLQLQVSQRASPEAGKPPLAGRGKAAGRTGSQRAAGGQALVPHGPGGAAAVRRRWTCDGSHEARAAEAGIGTAREGKMDGEPGSGLTAQLVRAMAEEKRQLAQQIRKFEARPPLPTMLLPELSAPPPRASHSAARALLRGMSLASSFGQPPDPTAWALSSAKSLPEAHRSDISEAFSAAGRATPRQRPPPPVPAAHGEGKGDLARGQAPTWNTAGAKQRPTPALMMATLDERELDDVLGMLWGIEAPGSGESTAGVGIRSLGR